MGESAKAVRGGGGVGIAILTWVLSEADLNVPSWVLIVLGVVAGLLILSSLVGFYRTWRSGIPKKPGLSLGEPIVNAPQQLNYPLTQGLWQSLGSGRVMRIPVVNAQGAGDATRVHATLRFTDMDEEPQMNDQPGRWRDQPEHPEIDIPGNGRPHELDLFVRFSDDAGGSCYVWNNESLVAGVRRDEFRCDAREFLLQIIVKGKQPEATLDKTFRIFSMTIPQIVPEGEKFAWES